MYDKKAVFKNNIISAGFSYFLDGIVYSKY